MEMNFNTKYNLYIIIFYFADSLSIFIKDVGVLPENIFNFAPHC